MKTSFLGLILLIAVSCNQKVQSDFSLQGTTNNIENGTILYLEDNLTNQLIDSSVVNNNEFAENRPVKEKSEKFTIGVFWKVIYL